MDRRNDHPSPTDRASADRLGSDRLGLVIIMVCVLASFAVCGAWLMGEISGDAVGGGLADLNLSEGAR